MRMHLLIASALFLALTVAPAMAAPGWLALDGSLADWGANPAGADWFPDRADTYYTSWTLDDVVHSTNSGGEWYDIEALYVNLTQEGDTQYVSWALVTSYAGNEAGFMAAGDPVAYRNGTGGTSIAFPYRRHPVLSLDFLKSGQNWEHGAFPGWDWGIIMAPDYDWQWNGTTRDFSTSIGLQDYDRGTVGNDSTDAWPPDTRDQTAGGGWVPSISTTPQLWDVNSVWRGPHPNEFPVTWWERPVDFDVRATSGNTNLGANGAVSGTWLYDETTQVNQTYWKQRDNWLWEGWVEFPDAANGGFDFESITTEDQIAFSYALWCGNNHTWGDSAMYGAPPRDDSPELGTWALLLATGALGGWARRRRTV